MTQHHYRGAGYVPMKGAERPTSTGGSGSKFSASGSGAISAEVRALLKRRFFDSCERELRGFLQFGE